MFRTYLATHASMTIAAFSVTAAWVIVSGIRRSTARTKCEVDFFSTASGSLDSEGQSLCNIFSWIDLGLMAGLWVILAIMQVRRAYVFDPPLTHVPLLGIHVLRRIILQ